MAVKQAVEVVPILKKLSKARQKAKRKAILDKCPCKVYDVITDISRNTLKGNIKMPSKNLKALRQYKNEIRMMSKKIPRRQHKKLLIQKGGALLPLLIPPALTLLDLLIRKR